jgi:hypothetical protein
MTPKIQSSLNKLAHGEPLPREEFLALLQDPNGREELAKLALVRSLFHPGFEPSEPAGATDPEDSGLKATDVASGHTRLAWTALARSGRFPELLGELTPWVPWLLQSVRLPETLAGQFLDYLRQVLPSFGPSQRIREVMPGWLIAFARQHAPEVAVDPEHVRIDLAFIRAGAVDLVLSRSDGGETPWATQVRDYLRKQHLRAPDEMLAVPLPEALASNPMEILYRKGLYEAACRLEQNGLIALEFTTAA